MKYTFTFHKDVEISDEKELLYLITHWCDECKKDYCDSYWCSGADSAYCHNELEKLVDEWKKEG